MFPVQQVFPDQLPSNMDYHALLHTQIYDYFLSAGMYSCGQALLNSDYNLRHQVMHAAAQRCTTEPRIATPSLLDSGFGSSYSSPCEEPYPTEQEDLSRAQTEPALLYQWFCTFWDALISSQAQATGVPVQDCLSYPPDLPTNSLEAEPKICQDLFSLQSSLDVIESLPSEVDSFELHCASWAPNTPQSDTASTSSRKRKPNNKRLSSFQKILGELIQHNEGIVKDLRSQVKGNTTKYGSKRPQP